ncbi:MAG: dihydrofolate reductase [Eubacteriales bacterium]|nr:dihydrofolate reductase [Eubacteriales bacterium]
MKFIVAVDKEYGIAKDGDLLAWLPNDLQFFKNKTIGNVVIMGRKTLESLPKGKPLPNRINLILTRDRNYQCENAIVLHSPEEVMEWLETQRIPEEQVFVSGGAEIYQLFLPFCTVGYITEIDHRFGADRFIEKIKESPEWEEAERSERQREKGLEYEWVTYHRKKGK